MTDSIVKLQQQNIITASNWYRTLEPMLFGLGEGLGFYLLEHGKTMDFPFIGGRIKPDLLKKNITKT